MASAKATLSSGQSKTITLDLNAAGRSLLRKRRTLEASLTVTQRSATGKAATVKTQNLTLKAAKLRHRKIKHRRRGRSTKLAVQPREAVAVRSSSKAAKA